MLHFVAREHDMEILHDMTFCRLSMSSMFRMEEADPGLSLLGFFWGSMTTSIFMAPFCVFSSLYWCTPLGWAMVGRGLAAGD